MNLESSRARYGSAELLESTAQHDPVEQLREWLELAYATPAIVEANAMCVATAGRDGTVSARMVLLRGLDERGLVFFTSYGSRKGQQIAENPHAAALFYWAPIHRQVRVEGTVRQLPEDESDAYFASRPRGHQLSAWASEQSETVEGRDVLDERLKHFEERFEGGDVPRPHSWGGYVITPERFEFWQGRENRMHDRLEYSREGRLWSISRLQP